MNYFDLIDIIAKFFFLYALLVATFLFIRQKREKKVDRALDYIKRWNSVDLREVTNILSDDEYEGYSIRELSKELEKDDYLKEEMRNAWDYFEEMAISIQYFHADEKILREYFQYTFISIFKISEGRILSQRARVSDPTLYRNMERLYGRWSFDVEFTEGGSHD